MKNTREIKSELFENINKIDKTLARCSKGKKRGDKLLK